MAVMRGYRIKKVPLLSDLKAFMQILPDQEQTDDAEESLKNAAATPEFYKRLLDQMSDGVYVVDRRQRICYWNQSAQRITGYAAAEVIGQSCQTHRLFHFDEQQQRLCAEHCPLTRCMREGDSQEERLYLLSKSGRRVPVRLRSQPIYSQRGAVVGAVEIFVDITAEHEMERRLEAMRRMAFLDHLTQLPNRRFLEMSLQALINDATTRREPFGVLMIDLDEFKEINDACGHNHGDRALQELGNMLTGTLRPSDTLGRWGGDEFLAIVYCLDETNLRAMAERCVAMVEDRLMAGENREFSLSISVGATLARHDDTMPSLIERADQLMYRSKSDGRGRATMK